MTRYPWFRNRPATRPLAVAIVFACAAAQAGAQSPAVPVEKAAVEKSAPAPAATSAPVPAAPAKTDAGAAAGSSSAAPSTTAPDATPKSDAASRGTARAGESPPAAEPAYTGPLAPLAWLNGCWKGSVGVGRRQREFREYWHPLRGNLMVGVGHNALPDQTVSFEYLRLEPRDDAVYYVAAQVGKPVVAFKLAETRREGGDEIFTFRTGGTGFPTYITYRRASLGWLYVEVGGRVSDKGAERDHKVTYPFRRVDCESGEFVKK